MDGFLGSVVSGLIAGVATAAIWAGIAYYINVVKGARIIGAISKSLSQSARGISVHADRSVGFSIENSTNYPVVIRSVALTGGTNMNSTITMSLHESSMKGLKENEFGWVEMPPHTKGAWTFLSLEKHLLSSFLPLTDIGITYEFKTIFGATRISTIHPPGSHRGYMIKAFNDAAAGYFPPRLV